MKNYVLLIAHTALRCDRFCFCTFSGLGAERKKPNRQPKSKVPPPIRLPEAVIKPHSGSVMNVAPLDRSRRKEIHEAAIAIDSLLVAHWTEHGEKESPRLKDDQFVRRIYLELGGRIPTLDETIAFLDSPKETKRADLIDTLLESPDYVSHFYNFWADILRLCERPQKQLFLNPISTMSSDRSPRIHRSTHGLMKCSLPMEDFGRVPPSDINCATRDAAALRRQYRASFSWHSNWLCPVSRSSVR